MRGRSVGGNRPDAARNKQGQDSSLGQSLVAARERRGLSRETVVQQTRIPAHYIRMLEDDDYNLISDRLYLLPFLRKYASFLEIDQDEIAMRLVRHVQQTDNSPPLMGSAPSFENSQRHRRRNWAGPILFGALIAVMIGAYIVQSRHSNLEAPTFQGALSSAPSSAETQDSQPSALPLVGNWRR